MLQQVFKSANWAFFFVILVLALFPVVPTLEARFFPVVSGFRVSAWDIRNGDEWWFEPVVTKHRNCKFLGITWYVGEPEGPFVEVLLETETDVIVGRNPSRPTGFQLLGWWHSIVPPSYAQMPDLHQFGLVTHSCHPIWESRTILGPIPYYPSTRGKD